jgi:flavin-dependent dehydrogenase
VEDGLVNACCLVHRDTAGDLGAARDFGAWMVKAARSRALAQRLTGGEQATATVVTAPVEVGLRTAAIDSVLLAGDAAGFLDPFAGDGLATAILSGRLAADLLVSGSKRSQPPETISLRYSSALKHAIQPSHRSTALARTLVRAPHAIQRVAAAGLLRPRLAQALVERTRFRSAGTMNQAWWVA